MKRAYFDRMDPAREENYSKCEPLYRAWLHLSRWASKSRSAAKRLKSSEPGKPPGAP